MLVKLLKNIEENGGIKLSKHTNRPSVAFVAGAVIEMSAETGKKYIDRGDGEAVETAAAKPQAEAEKAGTPAQ